jgi:hypothetical protein
MSYFTIGSNTLLWTHLILFIKHIKESKIINNLFYLNQTPFQYCTITGIICGIHIKSNNTIITVNDGTESIDCVNWNTEKYQLGMIIQVKGKVALFKDQIQININSITIGDYKTELFHWAQAMKLYKLYTTKQSPFFIQKENILSDFTQKENYLLDYLKTEKEVQFNQIDIPNKSKSFRSLVKDGIIYQKSIELDSYELISIDNLGLSVIELLNQNELYLDELLMLLKKDCRWKHVKRKRFYRILQEMINVNLISRLGSKYTVKCDTRNYN